MPYKKIDPEIDEALRELVASIPEIKQKAAVDNIDLSALEESDPIEVEDGIDILSGHRIAAVGDIITQEGEDEEFVVEEVDEFAGKAKIKGRETGSEKEVELDTLDVDEEATSLFQASIKKSVALYTSKFANVDVAETFTNFLHKLGVKNANYVDPQTVGYSIAYADRRRDEFEAAIDMILADLASTRTLIKVSETTEDKPVKTVEEVKTEIEEFESEQAQNTLDTNPEGEEEGTEGSEEEMEFNENAPQSGYELLVKENPQAQELLLDDLATKIEANPDLAKALEASQVEIDENDKYGTLVKVSNFVNKWEKEASKKTAQDEGEWVALEDVPVIPNDFEVWGDDIGQTAICFKGKCYLVQAPEGDMAKDYEEIACPPPDGTGWVVLPMSAVWDLQIHRDLVEEMRKEASSKKAQDEEVVENNDVEESNPLEGLEEWQQTALRELSAKLDVPLDALEIVENPHWFSSNSFHVSAWDKATGNNGESEWLITKDENAAEEAAESDIRNLADEEGWGTFNQDWLMSFIDVDTLNSALWQDKSSVIYEDMRDMSPEELVDSYPNLEGMFYNDIEIGSEEWDEAIDSIDQTNFADWAYYEIIDELEDEFDGLEYLRDIYGDELTGFDMLPYIDEEAAIENAIATDGVDHFLDRYDGVRVELPSGALAFGWS